MLLRFRPNVSDFFSLSHNNILGNLEEQLRENNLPVICPSTVGHLMANYWWFLAQLFVDNRPTYGKQLLVCWKDIVKQ